MRNRLYIAIAASLISAPLFAAGIHGDMDGDGLLNDAEFTAYTSENGVYADFDANGDGFIDEDEFDAIEFKDDDDSYEARAELDVDTWDADDDDRLNETEFNTMVFSTFDENEDGHWDDDERDDADDAGMFDA